MPTINPESPENFYQTWSAEELQLYRGAEAAMEKAGSFMDQVIKLLPEQRDLVMGWEEADGAAREAYIAFFQARMLRLLPTSTDVVIWGFKHPTIRIEDMDAVGE
jgi:hypothetical protein